MGAKTLKPVTALQRFASQVKDADKAKRGPAEALQRIIDDYCVSGEFSAYIENHADDVAKYLKPDKSGRPGRWRASGAGKCPQEQAFNFIARAKPGRFEPNPALRDRKPEAMRALTNGTFGHVRYHLMFDALHEKGIIKTLFAEDLRYYAAGQLSGTVDRVIEFEWAGTLIRAVIDFKTMKTTYFDPLLAPTPENEKQQMGYALFEYGASYWIMLYECKNTHRLKIYARPYDEIAVGAIKEQLRKLNNWSDLILAGAINDQLPKLPLITEWCNFCPFSKVYLVLNPDRDGKKQH